MSLAVILVHYHAGDWLAKAVAALRVDAPEAELIVVDNGSDAAERAAMAALPVRVLDAGGNRGYAGGLNLGVAATAARRLVLMNPDVEVLPGCLPALLARLEAGAAAAGPRFYWDRGKELLLPPTETQRAVDLLLRHHAPLAEASWRRHARRHWLATAPLPSHDLSGALLAVRRDAWQPFDEGFQLYFEETEWLHRLRRRGLRAEHVPAAEAVHHYNQSAAHEPAAARWFAESRARFERLRHPAWLRALAARLPGPAAPPPPAASFDGELALPPAARWIEVSPSPRGFPAAGARLAPGTRSWRFPESVPLAPGTYHLAVLGPGDAPLLRRSFDRGKPAPAPV